MCRLHGIFWENKVGVNGHSKRSTYVRTFSSSILLALSHFTISDWHWRKLLFFTAFFLSFYARWLIFFAWIFSSLIFSRIYCFHLFVFFYLFLRGISNFFVWRVQGLDSIRRIFNYWDGVFVFNSICYYWTW